MIKDLEVLGDIQDAWRSVRAAQRMIGRNTAPTGVPPMSHDFRNLAYSLTLLFAFSVLEDALTQLRDEGHFKCKSHFLGSLMRESAKARFPWKNYSLIEVAYQSRNEVAHRRIWLERGLVWRYLDAIESELKGWRILPASNGVTELGREEDD